MANIVLSIHNPLIALNGRYPYFEYFVNKLVEYGNNVLLFEQKKHVTDYNKIPDRILKQITDFKPDLFLFMNNQFYDVSDYFEVPIVIFDVDSPNVYANIDNIKNNIDRYKFFTITRSGVKLIQDATKANKNNICYIPPFTGCYADDKINQNINIGFCGSHWVYNDWFDIDNFIKLMPSPKERVMAKRVLKEYINNPTKTLDELYSQLGFEPINKLDSKSLYVLSTRLSGLKRLRYLTEVADLGLEVRGAHWNPLQPRLQCFPEVLLCYSPENVNNLKTTQLFYNQCKIGFNINHIQALSGFSWRTADILASNACLVTQKSADLEELGFKLPTYESKIEARELCQKLLKEDNYRQDLVLHSHELINKNHRFENIMPIMERFLNIRLNNREQNGSLGIFDISSYKDVFYNDLKLKNKIRYNLLNILNKKQKFNSWDYKIYSRLGKKLIRKGIDIDYTKCLDFEKQQFESCQNNYSKKLNALSDKIKNNKKIMVYFQVVFDSVFPGEILFEKMLSDDVFEPKIVVIPDVLRGKENMFYQMDKTYNTLVEKYGQDNVLKSWDETKKKFIDFSNCVDILCSANPYDGMTHYLYRINTLHKKTLPIYFNYGYPAVSFARESVASLTSLSLMWKIFSESEYIMQEYSKTMRSNGKNLVLSGYMKMDNLAKHKVHDRDRKRIIIAPHHTIGKNFKNSIGLSNFLEYADLFLELPKKYPQIDFVFRPHPLLRVALEKDNMWGKMKTKKYFDEIQDNKNLLFQDGGEYFETFVNSDGMIHDCSSFLAEYMFTGKPVCYMLANPEAKEKYFMDNGKSILDHTYEAYKEDDIISFIDNVILGENDAKKSARQDFVKGSLMFNYPNVSDFVLQHIKNSIIES